MNNTSPGLKNLDNRLSLIESKLNNEINKTPSDELDKLIYKYKNEEKKKQETQLIKRREELEMNLENYAMTVKEIIKDTQEKLLVAIEHVIKFIEENAPRIKTIIDMSIEIAVNIPKSDFKLHLAIKILKMIFDVIDENDVIGKINYMVSIFFPHVEERKEEVKKKNKKRRSFFKTILR